MADPLSRATRIRLLADALQGLTDSQLAWTEGVIAQFQLNPEIVRKDDSDIVGPCVLERFGDALQIHHVQLGKMSGVCLSKTSLFNAFIESYGVAPEVAKWAVFVS